MVLHVTSIGLMTQSINLLTARRSMPAIAEALLQRKLLQAEWAFPYEICQLQCSRSVLFTPGHAGCLLPDCLPLSAKADDYLVDLVSFLVTH